MAVEWVVTTTTALEMAQEVGKPIERATLNRWCQGGVLPARKVGGIWAIDAPALRQFLAEYEPGARRGKSTHPPRRRPSEIAGISPTEFAVYQFIIAYKGDHDGNSPTLREIAAGIGLASVSDLPTRLRRLEQVGLIWLTGSGPGQRICITGGKWLPPEQNGENAPNNQEGSRDTI